MGERRISTLTGLIALTLAVVLLPAGRAAAADDGEFYVNTYRSIGTVSVAGPRAMAMGGTGRGMADGVSSIGGNPAGLGAFSGTGFEAGLGYDWLDDGYDDTDQVTFRLGGAMGLDNYLPYGAPRQGLGAMLYTEGYSGAAGVGMKRDQTGVVMAYGRQLMDNLLGGVSVGIFDGKWKQNPTDDGVYLDRSFTGGEFKLGALYRCSDETTFGGVFSYTTSSFREKAPYAAYGGSGSLGRWRIGAGVAHQMSDETLLTGDLWYDRLSTEIPHVVDERNRAWGLAAGVEQQVLPEVLALRGGLYYDHTSYSSSGSSALSSSYGKGRFGFTAGAGIKLYSFDIAYSLDINSGGDVKNLLDVSAEW